MKGVRREEPDSSEGQLGEDFHPPRCFAISNDEARLMLHTKRMKEPLKTFAKAFSHSEEYVSRVSRPRMPRWEGIPKTGTAESTYILHWF